MKKEETTASTVYLVLYHLSYVMVNLSIRWDSNPHLPAIQALIICIDETVRLGVPKDVPKD